MNHRTATVMITAVVCLNLACLFAFRAPSSNLTVRKGMLVIKAGYTNGTSLNPRSGSVTCIDLRYRGNEIYSRVVFEEGLPLNEIQLEQVLPRKRGIVPIGDILYRYEIKEDLGKPRVLNITEIPISIIGFEPTAFSIGLFPESFFTIERSRADEPTTVELASIDVAAGETGVKSVCECQIEVFHGAIPGLRINQRPADRLGLLTLRAGEMAAISEYLAVEFVRIVPWNEVELFGGVGRVPRRQPGHAFTRRCGSSGKRSCREF